MQTSTLIARLIGPIVVVADLVALGNPKAMRELAQEFLAGRALLYIAAFLALLGGLAIVNTQNVWTAGWPVIITILGWLAVIDGVIRAAYPALSKSIGEAMLAREAVLRVTGGIQMLFGAYLMFEGYK